MAVSEFERHQILQWFQESMGPERGAIMMQLIPPVGWGDIATKHDLSELEGRLDARFRVLSVELRGEMAELRGDLKGSQAELVRMLFLAMVASNATLVGLVLAAVRLG